MIRKKLKKLLRLVANDFKVLTGKSIMVSASVSYGYDGDLYHFNWGDDLNHYLLSEISHKPVVMANDTLLAKHMTRNYLVIGSTIEMLANGRSIVWGAGLMHEHSLHTLPASDFRAVRGPLTRKALIQRYNKDACPAIYGDPALLLPLCYRPATVKKHRIGIIPHYSDLEACRQARLPEDVHPIAIRNYGHWHEFIDEISECDVILSSSLHGLIVAEAYGVPCRWVEFEKCEARDHFKYHDFFASIGKTETPAMIDKGMHIEALQDLCADWHPMSFDVRPLLQSCPFELRKHLLQ